MFWASGALAAVTTVASALTFWIPGVLTGPDVMNGSARGTALVLLVVAVPLMTGAMGPALRGSSRAVMVWIGAAGYIAYNAFMFVFATPFNSLFLVYVAMLSLSILALGTLLIRVDPTQVGAAKMPTRPIAVYIWVVVLLNALAWLRTIVPATLGDDPTEILVGTGLATNPVFVIDLAFWLPMMALAAFGLWHTRPWGVLLSGSGLVFWVVEALGVAVDQWYGSNSDPASSIVSTAAVPAFLIFAVVGLIPVWFHFRSANPELTL